MAASAFLLRSTERFLSRRRPGRALAFVARSSVPVIAVDWLAQREPERGTRSDVPISALVHEIDPAPAVRAGVLDGEPVVVKDGIDVGGHRTGNGLLDGGDL